MKGDSLGDRMKRYERATRTVLTPRTPIIVRVDGKAFHTLTRACEKPFDHALITAMDWVALALCEEIQGAQFAYVQSDEVSVLVHGYKRFGSQAWFDGEVQKIVSVSASVATAAFAARSRWGVAHFDSRAFVLPEAEVCNYFGWRQNDAVRNSIQMLARSLYSHRECHQKDQSALQEMCFAAGRNWNDLEPHLKRGRCVYRAQAEDDPLRMPFGIDREPPTFFRERSFVERHLAVEES